MGFERATKRYASSFDIGSVTEAATSLESASPEAVLEWGFSRFGDRLTIATGFGAEGAALIDMAAKVNPNIDVFFIDTGFLFPETYELRRRIEQRYNISIRAVSTNVTPARQEQLYGPALWRENPDLCCQIRKLEPLKIALEGREAWVTAIRRDQTVARASARKIEWDQKWGLVKINPLVSWSRRDVWHYLLAGGVPYNPLHDQGYPSIGCLHCTRPVGEGEHERAGRWSGHVKTECGLHGVPQPALAT